MKIKQWLQKNKKRLEGLSKSQIVKLGEAETGRTGRCIYIALRDISVPKLTKTGTIDDFKKLYDPRRRIKEMIDSLPDDAYITNMEMAKSCSIGANELKANREYFSKNIIHVGENMYWAKSRMINKMKKVLQS